MITDGDFLNRVFKRREEIVSRSITEETILVPIKGNLADMQKIFSLNPVAEFIWHHLDGQKNLQEIRHEIHTAFDAEEEAEADIREFVSELLREDLIIAVD